MQVFKAYFKVLKKKLPSALIYIIVFLAIAFPLANSSRSYTGFTEESLNVAVFDKDNTDASRELTDYIAKRHSIVEVEEDRDTLMDMLYYGSIDYALVIEKGYMEKISNEQFDDLFSNYKLHEGYEAVLMGQLLNEYVTALKSYIAVGESVKSAIKNTKKTLDESTQVQYVNGLGDGDNDFGEDFAFYFQYIPYVLICAMMNALCPTLMALRQKDIRYRTNCSPIKNSSATIQTVCASAICVFSVWLIFMVAGMIMYGGIYRGRAWYAVLNSFIFAAIVTVLAVLVANLAKKQETVNIITQIVGLGMSFLCGVFVPQYLLGDGVLKAAHFLPAYWYVKVNNMLSGVDVFDEGLMITCFLVQTCFVIAIACLAMVVNRVSYQGGILKLSKS